MIVEDVTASHHLANYLIRSNLRQTHGASPAWCNREGVRMLAQHCWLPRSLFLQKGLALEKEVSRSLT
jgi:hypothetical protein